MHSCLLCTVWDVATLQQAMLDDAPLFFVLTNTRGMAAKAAAELTREVCQNLKIALTELKKIGRNINPILVSRSDSTLRGHYPVETDVIAAELGPFDAHFLVPAFFEGGRSTRDSVHYLKVNGKDTQVHETEFAKDSVFGYSHSYLPDYVEEKTAGKIRAAQVERFVLSDVRGDSLPRLMQLQDNACCVVDAVGQGDLDHFAVQLQQAAKLGKRFMFRSAASLLTSLAGLSAQPVAAKDMARYVRCAKPGAVIAGSHVKQTTLQLEQLLKMPGIAAIEVDVERLANESAAMLEEIIRQCRQSHEAGLTLVVYTSRVEKAFAYQAAPYLLLVLLIYSPIVVGLATIAFYVRGRITSPPYIALLIGCNSIVFSDTLIGLTAFAKLTFPLAPNPVWILSTYIVGIFLVFNAVIFIEKQSRNVK